MLAAELLDRVAAIDAEALCDGDKEIRVMDAGLRPVTSFRQMVGRARTVRCRDDFLSVIQALPEGRPQVSPADRGGVGIRLPSRYDGSVFGWRRFQRHAEVRLV